jgi:hypothetical protein
MATALSDVTGGASGKNIASNFEVRFSFCFENGHMTLSAKLSSYVRLWPKADCGDHGLGRNEFDSSTAINAATLPASD